MDSLFSVKEEPDTEDALRASGIDDSPRKQVGVAPRKSCVRKRKLDEYTLIIQRKTQIAEEVEDEPGGLGV